MLNSNTFKMYTNKNNYSLNFEFLNINFFFFLVLQKYNLISVYFFIVDKILYKNKSNHTELIFVNSLKTDIHYFITNKFFKKTKSLSSIFSNCIWIERELRELNEINYITLNDNRKLLLNYNYNNIISYNNYNNIINDLNI